MVQCCFFDSRTPSRKAALELTGYVRNLTITATTRIQYASNGQCDFCGKRVYKLTCPNKKTVINIEINLEV